MADIALPRLAALSPRRRLLLAALTGAAAGIGQAPLGVPWVSLAAFALIFATLRRCASARQAAWTGWAAIMKTRMAANNFMHLF